ncbi:hypothetical protein [Acinetobacter terrae]|uniref:Uncharacterized protein n=1 Tax=Acinetobacter terrae TaxID=2731247 RepID=A0A4V2LPW1_9GAMM|nr:hypothetical protein [Acinetobacter terrae]TCB59861.1 hypothetical protein E0H85_06340 [Acinetobacter terrae]
MIDIISKEKLIEILNQEIEEQKVTGAQLFVPNNDFPLIKKVTFYRLTQEGQLQWWSDHQQAWETCYNPKQVVKLKLLPEMNLK